MMWSRQNESHAVRLAVLRRGWSVTVRDWSVTGTIAVIDIATGKTQWSVQTTASGQRRGFTALTAIPAVVFAGGRDGVRAFASDSGRALWGFHMLQHVQTVN